jgi:hypothetical protein
MCERNECYIGSTKQTLARRFSKHKTRKQCSSRQLVERYGADRLEIIQLEECNEETRFIRERWWIENTPCINILRPFRTNEELVEETNARSKKYYEENRERMIETQKKHYEANKEKIAEYKRQYSEANREKIAENKRQYYESNREKIAELKRQSRLRKKNLSI